MDRLLPFDFSFEHCSGRTLAMADYLSKHPSEYEGALGKWEHTFNDWFTINVVDKISPNLPRLANPREHINLRESEKAKRKNTSDALTAYKPLQTINESEEVAKLSITASMADFKDLSTSKISNIHVKENARLIV